MHIEDLRNRVGGTVIAEGEVGFTTAREGFVWNGRKPATTPRVIVKARSAADVQAAVRYGAAHGLRVSARSGGHNWSGIALQEGVAIDLSDLDAIKIDREARLAEVQPAAKNLDLAVALTAEGLAFPVGHCGGVALGGYLLGGGFGWNEGHWGPACHLIEKAEVVLADGRIVMTSATENPDLFWALRGAGPLFFGIVTRFWLRLLPLPPAIVVATWTYPLDRVAELSHHLKALVNRMPSFVETTLSLACAPPHLGLGDAKFATLIATVYAGTMIEASAVLRNLSDLVPPQPLAASPVMPVDFATLYSLIDPAFPEAARYGVDMAWTDDADLTLEVMAQLIAEAPSVQSNAICVLYGRNSVMTHDLPDAALSVVGPVCGILHGTWGAAEADGRNLAWLRDGMDRLDPVTLGRYVGHADLARPGRLAQCYSPEALDRLSALARHFDPQGLFGARQVQETAADRPVAAE